jgi:hypothetical protein
MKLILATSIRFSPAKIVGFENVTNLLVATEEEYSKMRGVFWKYYQPGFFETDFWQRVSDFLLRKSLVLRM